jgi:DNA-binding GntR family transcriptional regulator
MTDSPFDAQVLEQIRGTTRRSDRIYEAIREAIASGRIPPGQWLRQEALAQEFNASQGTIREALQRLTSQGVIVYEPYKGARTVVLPVDDQVDLLEIRARLEGLAMENAAGRLTFQDLARMQAILPNTVLKAGAGSAGPAWEANREFHMIAIRASGRRHLVRVLESIWDLTNHYWLFGCLEPQRRVDVAKLDMQDHVQILEALRAGDGKRASEVAMAAIHRALGTVRELMPGE